MKNQKQNTLTAIPESMRPTEADWIRYRDGAVLKCWSAALLTLNIKPNLKNKEFLEKNFPEIYALFNLRVSVILKRRITDADLRPVSEILAKSQRNDFVSLAAISRLATELDWDGNDYFRNHLTINKSESFSGKKISITEKENINSIEKLGIGNKRTLLRYAALIRLLCMSIENKHKFEKFCKEIFRHKKVTNQEIGLAIERTVATFAEELSADSVPYGFQQDANADEVAKAKAVVKALLG
jgi:hypothetical protein